MVRRHVEEQEQKKKKFNARNEHKSVQRIAALTGNPKRNRQDARPKHGDCTQGPLNTSMFAKRFAQLQTLFCQRSEIKMSRSPSTEKVTEKGDTKDTGTKSTSPFGKSNKAATIANEGNINKNPHVIIGTHQNARSDTCVPMHTNKTGDDVYKRTGKVTIARKNREKHQN